MRGWIKWRIEIIMKKKGGEEGMMAFLDKIELMVLNLIFFF